MNSDIENMNEKDLTGCINHLLFSPSQQQTDKELFTIIVLRDKRDKFDFLKGFTKWPTTGTWEDCPDEKNVSLEIEFKDTPKEEVGNRLLKLFETFNKNVVKEQLLYVRTTPIEESSL